MSIRVFRVSWFPVPPEYLVLGWVTVVDMNGC